METKDLVAGVTYYFRGETRITYQKSYEAKVGGSRRKFYMFSSPNLGPFGITRSEVKDNLGTKRTWS